MTAIRWMIALLVSGWVASPAVAQEELRDLEEAVFRAAVARVADSVVRIETAGGRDRVGAVSVGQAPSTGLVVSKEGHILTSTFTMAGNPAAILVTLHDGTRLPANRVATDHSRKLVLLKIDTENELTVPKFRDRDELQVGQWTIALGRVFDPKVPNISVGVLSAKHRIWSKAIQTDAKISPHNYGGPLIDVEGKVLGILVPMSPRTNEDIAGADWYDSGIGFAVPVAELLPSIEIMKQGQDLWPGQLGISMDGINIYADAAKLAIVQAGSPAAKAGLQVGDEIVAIDGQPVERQAQLKHALGTRYAGETIRVRIEREGSTQEVEVELAQEILPYRHSFLGVLASRDDGPADSELDSGLAIRLVYTDSPASRAGLRGGDRILSIANQTFATVTEAQNIVAQFEPGAEIELAVDRGAPGDPELVSVELSVLPNEVPTDLPIPEGGSVDEAIAPDRAVVPIKLPEEQGECIALLPRNYDPQQRYGALVLFHAAGEYNEQRLLTDWLPLCEQYQLILIAPRSNDEKRWARTDLEFARKSLDQALSRYPIDRARVATYGYQSGGSMALLFACTYRDMVRGIAMTDGNLVREAIQARTAPLQRLSVYAHLNSEHASTEGVTAGLNRMREAHFPMLIREAEGASRRLDESERHDLMRWFDCLDQF